MYSSSVHFLCWGRPARCVITLFVLYIVKLFFVLLLGVQRCFFIADTPYRQKPRKLVRLASAKSRVLSFQNSNPYTRRTIRGDGASCTPEAISYFAYRVFREETICLKQLRSSCEPEAHQTGSAPAILYVAALDTHLGKATEKLGSDCCNAACSWRHAARKIPNVLIFSS